MEEGTVTEKEEGQGIESGRGELREEIVPQNQNPTRLDSFLSGILDKLSKSFIKKLVRTGKVKIDGKVCDRPSRKVKSGERIEVSVERNEAGEMKEIISNCNKQRNSNKQKETGKEAREMDEEEEKEKEEKEEVGDLPILSSKIKPEKIPLEILHEDDDVIVLVKPKGMVVHPSPDSNSQYSGTLVNALLEKYGRQNLATAHDKLGIRPGIVHRLDKETSGVMLVAKNDKAFQHLSQQFKVHSNKRIYYGLAHRKCKITEDTIETMIGRHPVDGRKRAVLEDFVYVDREKRKVSKLDPKKAKKAVTHFKVLKTFNGEEYETCLSLLEFKLETGRTHQIRVHCKHMHMPLVNDEEYSNSKSFQKKKGKPTKVLKEMFLLIQKERIAGQFLHAGLIGFVHPSTNHYLEFSSPLPSYFTKVLNFLSKYENKRGEEIQNISLLQKKEEVEIADEEITDFDLNN